MFSEKYSFNIAIKYNMEFCKFNNYFLLIFFLFEFNY